MMFDEIISLCCMEDANTWKIASSEIVKKIPAKKYTVIVPDESVQYFQSISDGQYQVEPESLYSNNYKHKLLAAISPEVKTQHHWYLQQLIKLSALEMRPANQNILIWDGDTVPLKTLNFFSASGNLRYYLGVEKHTPYFDTIERLLGIAKQTPLSFIAQNFPINTSWFRDFCQHIENKSNLCWSDAILKAIDFSKPNSFSEYETLGTFIFSRYKDQVELNERSWQRHGNSLIGSIELLNTRRADKVLSDFDYVSFEKWDRLKPHFTKVVLPILAHKILKKIASSYPSK